MTTYDVCDIIQTLIDIERFETMNEVTTIEYKNNTYIVIKKETLPDALSAHFERNGFIPLLYTGSKVVNGTRKKPALEYFIQSKNGVFQTFYH